MRAARRRQSISRVIVAMLIAFVAVARGGGVAIACESVAQTLHNAADSTTHASMPGHEQPEHDGCDAPERVSECALMPACAPAVSATAIGVGDVPTPATAIAPPPTRAPVPVDRAPEPPPPRA